MRTLWGLHYSPWTEKARWALDHHGVDYRYREHQVLLGEPGLRWRARRRSPGTPASVPLLIDGDAVFGDSTDIARLADRVGGGAPLFPAALEHDIDRWLRASDGALHGARALVVAAVGDSSDAQVESLPPLIPRPLRPAMRPVARMGARFLASKYGADLEARARHLDGMLAFCRELDAALDGPYLLGQLSYADFACAVVINSFSPLRQRFFADKPATNAAWTRDELVEEFGGLVAWRDQLYAQHRK